MTDPNSTPPNGAYPPPPPGYQPIPTYAPAAQPAPPQYGEYGTPAYGAPGDGAPQYGAGPAGWAPPMPAPRSRTLGLTSMLIALPLFVLSIIASAVVGVSIGPFATRTANGFSYSSGDLPADQAAALAPVGILMAAQILVGTALGILALVLGIIAVATKRGRPFGIVGIIVAVAAPILSFAVYAVATVATLPPA